MTDVVQQNHPRHLSHSDNICLLQTLNLGNETASKSDFSIGNIKTELTGEPLLMACAPDGVMKTRMNGWKQENKTQLLQNQILVNETASKLYSSLCFLSHETNFKTKKKRNKHNNYNKHHKSRMKYADTEEY